MRSSKKGQSFGIKPCGLGARDTLRLEMCYPLNGSDLSPEHNPIEAGLGFFVDLTKRRFHRPRGPEAGEGRRQPRKLGRFQHERQRAAAAPALSGLGRRRTDRRGDQRHAFAELESGHRHGIRSDRAREDRQRDRDRNSRPKISRCHREETTLQKIMTTFPTIFFTPNPTNGSASKARTRASASPITRRPN